MNRIITIIYIIFISACSSNKFQKVDDIETISVDVHNTSLDASIFIEKIEVVPLETNDSSLINSYKKIEYDKDMDVYAIYDKEQIVHTFRGDGTYIANSRKMMGKGPKEYYMAVDMKFNPYLQGIDLLNPYGVIYTYDLTFDFISKKQIKPEFFFDALMALDNNNYIFTTPSIWTNQEISFVNVETKQQNIAQYDGTISSGNTMEKECFYKNGNNIYFVPKGINYYFYRVDPKNYKLIPIIYLDFGDAEICEDDLPGVAVGERTQKEGIEPDKKRDDLLKGMQERSQYIRDNNFIVPLIKFFNDDYIYIYFAKSRKGFGGHYIYNRKSKKGFLLNEGKPLIMQPCFGITDNVLMAICDAYYAPRLVDTALMSQIEREKLKQLNEEDNPVILKYYLRK